MRYRTPVKRARGLGSAKDGVGHWWMQRLTALALIPLGLWFAASVIGLLGADYLVALAWLGQPYNTVLMALLLVAAFHHSWLGVQVVVEDYVHAEGVKIFTLVTLQFLHVLLGAYALYIVLRIGFGN